jgi:hypothetical protein
MPSLTINLDGSPHTHTYIRSRTKAGKPNPHIYRCAHPDCSHYTAKHLLDGKRSVCAICGLNEILLTAKQLKLARPHCLTCSNEVKAKAIQAKIAKLEELGIL